MRHLTKTPFRLALVLSLGLGLAVVAGPEARAQQRPKSRDAHAIETAKRAYASGVEILELHLDQTKGHAPGRRWGMRWDATKQECRVFQSNPGHVMPMKDVTFDVCERVRKMVLEVKSGLVQEITDKVNGKRSGSVGSAPAGRLRIFGTDLHVRLSLSPRCDENGENCVQPEISAASAVGQELRDALAAELGRLPVHPRGGRRHAH